MRNLSPPQALRFFFTEASDWWRSARHEGRLLLSQERLPFYPSRLPLRAIFIERETSGYETDVRRSRKLTFVEMMSGCLGSLQVYHRKRLSLKRKWKKSYFQAIQVLTRVFLVHLSLGLVLGSFFYGYWVLQIPGAWVALKIGGTRVFGYGVLLTSLLAILTPIAARYHVMALVGVRIFQGLFLVSCSISSR